MYVTYSICPKKYVKKLEKPFRDSNTKLCQKYVYAENLFMHPLFLTSMMLQIGSLQ